MKNEIDLQQAHDLFVAIITGEIKVPALDREARRSIHASLDVLCWVLDHDHNSTFSCNLRAVRKAVAAAGYVEHQGKPPGPN